MPMSPSTRLDLTDTRESGLGRLDSVDSTRLDPSRLGVPERKLNSVVA